MIKFLMTSINQFIEDFLPFVIFIITVLSFGIMAISFVLIFYSLFMFKLNWLCISTFTFFGFFLLASVFNRLYNILMKYVD